MLEMQLILDLTLEHADTSTLLDCLFLNKHVHGVVMGLLKRQLQFMTELERMFDGDIYQGIRFMSGCDVEHLEYFENQEEVSEFLEINADKYDTEDLLEIYGRLYPFNVNTKAYYISNADWNELFIFIEDFGQFIDKYYYKLTPNMVGVLVFISFDMGQYIDVVTTILKKGFDPTKLVRIPGYYKTSILNYAIYKKIYWLVQEIFDTKPNLFVRDGKGNHAYKLFKPYRAKYEHKRERLNASMLHIYDTFDKLVAEQKPPKSYQYSTHRIKSRSRI